VLDHESEGVPGGLAEAFISQSDLNVAVLGYVLDALLHDVEQVASQTLEGLDKFGLDSRADLAAVVLEEYSDDLADGNAE